MLIMFPPYIIGRTLLVFSRQNEFSETTCKKKVFLLLDRKTYDIPMESSHHADQVSPVYHSSNSEVTEIMPVSGRDWELKKNYYSSLSCMRPGTEHMWVWSDCLMASD